MTRFLAFLTSLLLIAGMATANPSQWRHEWPETNFQKTSIDDWSEIMSGGPPKDGIPAIDDPKFLRAGDKGASRAMSR